MIHAPIEVGQAGREKCPDKYNEASTLWCPNAKKLVLQISKQKVFVQLGLMQQGAAGGIGSVQWQPEEPFIPLVASLTREFDAVRVRNWLAGAEAEVFITVA
jgi:hypothetical protein